MTQDAIVEKLTTIMAQSSEEDVDWSTVTGHTDVQSLGFDSLIILDLIYDIQQEFALEFDAEELVEITTIGELAEFIGQRSA